MKLKKLICAAAAVLLALTPALPYAGYNGLSVISYADALKCSLKYSDDATYFSAEPSLPGNTLRYTTNGSEVTKKSRKLPGGKLLKIYDACILKIAEFNSSGAVVASTAVEIKRRVLAPRIVAQDNFDGTATVTITCDDKDADIFYYTTEDNKGKKYLYTAPFTCLRSATISAVCEKDGFKESLKTELKISDIITEENYSEYIHKAYEAVNRERKKNGLPALKLDLDLCDLCYIRAQEVSADYNIKHNRPDGSKWYTVLRENDYDYLGAGENLVKLDSKGAAPLNAVTNWMNSKKHRENILNKTYDSVGFAFIQTGRYCVWVQILTKTKR